MDDIGAREQAKVSRNAHTTELSTLNDLTAVKLYIIWIITFFLIIVFAVFVQTCYAYE